MSDTNALRTRIASELNRALTDDFGNSGETFATAVNREINNAIRHYEAERFRWNEYSPQLEFQTTVSGTRTYSMPGAFTRIDTLKLVYNGNYIVLNKRSFEEIDSADSKVTTSNGPPTVYCVYGNKIRVYPVPNGSHTLVATGVASVMPTSVTGSYTAVEYVPPHSLTVTSSASHALRRDGWTSSGADLITARAKASIRINYLRDETAMVEMGAMSSTGFLSMQEYHAFRRHRSELVSLVSTGRIRGYDL